MTSIRVQKDKEWGIVEERLRMPPVDISCSEKLRMFVMSAALLKSIEDMERLGYKRIDVVPARRKIDEICCPAIAQKAGSPLDYRWETSRLQGDSDDAHNFGLATSPTEEIAKSGQVHLVCIVHFWEPKAWVNVNADLEMLRSLGPTDGGFGASRLEPELKEALVGDKFDDLLYR